MAHFKGVARGKTVTLEGPANLPEGTEVIVMPLENAKGSPRAALAAMDAAPQVKSEDIGELMRLIEEGKCPVGFGTPLTRKQ